MDVAQRSLNFVVQTTKLFKKGSVHIFKISGEVGVEVGLEVGETGDKVTNKQATKMS